MVNWTTLQNAMSPDAKPTPGWLLRDLCLNVRAHPSDCPEVAEFLMQGACDDDPNVQLKALICIKHLAADDTSFQQYMQACTGALRLIEDIGRPPLVLQSRSIESLEVRTIREIAAAALAAICTPHTVERSVEAADLRQKCHGFGNYEPPREESPDGVAEQLADLVGSSIGDVAEDIREKGAGGALKDAALDAVDMVLDGVDAVWGWVAGRSDASRICQPQPGPPAGFGLAGGVASLSPATLPTAFCPSPGAFPTAAYPPPPGAPPAGAYPPPPGAPATAAAYPPPPGAWASAGAPGAAAARSKWASAHYAAAFGGGVVGANNPVAVTSDLFPANAGPRGLAAEAATLAAVASAAPPSSAPPDLLTGADEEE